MERAGASKGAVREATCEVFSVTCRGLDSHETSSVGAGPSSTGAALVHSGAGAAAAARDDGAGGSSVSDSDSDGVSSGFCTDARRTESGAHRCSCKPPTFVVANARADRSERSEAAMYI